jgi:hypothetical protein
MIRLISGYYSGRIGLLRLELLMRMRVRAMGFLMRFLMILRGGMMGMIWIILGAVRLLSVISLILILITLR